MKLPILPKKVFNPFDTNDNQYNMKYFGKTFFLLKLAKYY